MTIISENLFYQLLPQPEKQPENKLFNNESFTSVYFFTDAGSVLLNTFTPLPPPPPVLGTGGIFGLSAPNTAALIIVLRGGTMGLPAASGKLLEAGTDVRTSALL